MKCDIVLAGVGGQGILSIARIIGEAALSAGLYLKQAEVHGMSQRGGDVQSHFRISDKPIYSDLIPFGGADMILSVEPMEALRYLPYLGPEGVVVTNSQPFVNIGNYPELGAVLKQLEALPRRVVLDAEQMARDLGNARGMNMVMAGAASQFMELPFQRMLDGVAAIFASKGEEVVRLNQACLEAGRKAAAEK